MEVLQVGDERTDLFHDLDRRTGSPAREPPSKLLANRSYELVPTVVLPAGHPFLGQFFEEWVDGARRRPPPPRAHPLHLVHDLGAALRRFVQDEQHPRPEAA